MTRNELLKMDLHTKVVVLKNGYTELGELVSSEMRGALSDAPGSPKNLDEALTEMTRNFNKGFWEVL